MPVAICMTCNTTHPGVCACVCVCGGQAELQKATVSVKSNSPSAVAAEGAYRFPEPVLTKNELGPNSSSESESWAG